MGPLFYLYNIYYLYHKILPNNYLDFAVFYNYFSVNYDATGDKLYYLFLNSYSFKSLIALQGSRRFIVLKGYKLLSCEEYYLLQFRRNFKRYGSSNLCDYVCFFGREMF